MWSVWHSNGVYLPPIVEFSLSWQGSRLGYGWIVGTAEIEPIIISFNYSINEKFWILFSLFLLPDDRRQQYAYNICHLYGAVGKHLSAKQRYRARRRWRISDIYLLRLARWCPWSMRTCSSTAKFISIFTVEMLQDGRPFSNSCLFSCLYWWPWVWFKNFTYCVLYIWMAVIIIIHIFYFILCRSSLFFSDKIFTKVKIAIAFLPWTTRDRSWRSHSADSSSRTQRALSALSARS